MFPHGNITKNMTVAHLCLPRELRGEGLLTQQIVSHSQQHVPVEKYKKQKKKKEEETGQP